MKEPKPATPAGAPEGTAWYGGPIEWFVLRLKITSKDLVPEEVTAVMGCAPDDAWQGGKPLLREDGSTKRIPKFGHWSLELRPQATDEWDCGEAMMILLQRLPSSIGVWEQLNTCYKVDVSFALLMKAANKGFALSPELMKYLGDRGMAADFDVYYEPDEAAVAAAGPKPHPAKPPASA